MELVMEHRMYFVIGTTDVICVCVFGEGASDVIFYGVQLLVYFFYSWNV